MSQVLLTNPDDTLSCPQCLRGSLEPALSQLTPNSPDGVRRTQAPFCPCPAARTPQSPSHGAARRVQCIQAVLGVPTACRAAPVLTRRHADLANRDPGAPQWPRWKAICLSEVLV